MLVRDLIYKLEEEIENNKEINNFEVKLAEEEYKERPIFGYNIDFEKKLFTLESYL